MAYANQLWWWMMLPVFGLLFWWGYRERKALFQNWLPGVLPLRELQLTYILRGMAVLFLLLALPGFYTLSENVAPNALSHQIYFMLDVSRSMETPDIQPNRLQGAKTLIRRTAAQFRGEQIGLILFTDQAYVQVPLTRDTAAFETMLKLSQPETFADKGTNYRGAMRLLSRQFAAVHNNPLHRTARAGVLISDGEDFGGHYRSAVSNLKQLGVQVIPVAMGTPTGGTVPLKPNEMRKLRQKPVSKLELSALKQLGDYFEQPVILDSHTPQARRQLKEAIENVPAMAATNGSPGQLHFYPYFLMLAIGALGISLFFLPQRI